MFKKYQFLLLLLFISVLSSCETEKNKKDKCAEIVNAFVANLPMDNYDILYKYYPNFKNVKRYWRVTDFKINTTTIDDDNRITISGSALRQNFVFILKKINGNYIIEDSKGLAAEFDSPLYRYCKKIGLINPNDYDKEISLVCNNQKEHFDQLVNAIVRNAEKNIKILNDNLANNYGYISGNVTLKNYGEIDIPNHCYELYFNFLSSNGQVLFTKKEILNFESISAGQSITYSLYEPSNGRFDKINAELRITSTKFIEEFLIENTHNL